MNLYYAWTHVLHVVTQDFVCTKLWFRVGQNQTILCGNHSSLQLLRYHRESALQAHTTNQARLVQFVLLAQPGQQAKYTAKHHVCENDSCSNVSFALKRDGNILNLVLLSIQGHCWGMCKQEMVTGVLLCAIREAEWQWAPLVAEFFRHIHQPFQY